jgi:hypothetical protein
MVLRRSIDRLLGGLDSFLEVRHVSSPNISVSESNAKVVQYCCSIGVVLRSCIHNVSGCCDGFLEISHKLWFPVRPYVEGWKMFSPCLSVREFL